jgi:hypothetical protein
MLFPSDRKGPWYGDAICAIYVDPTATPTEDSSRRGRIPRASEGQPSSDSPPCLLLAFRRCGAQHETCIYGEHCMTAVLDSWVHLPSVDTQNRPSIDT